MGLYRHTGRKQGGEGLTRLRPRTDEAESGNWTGCGLEADVRACITEGAPVELRRGGPMSGCLTAAFVKSVRHRGGRGTIAATTADTACSCR